MKITRIETLICDAGWRPWLFVKIQTDEGITGYGECSDSRNPYGVAGCIRDLEGLVTGQDPRKVNFLNVEMYRTTMHNRGGIAQTAIAGIDNALWDIKAKALGVPVYELLGGPTRDKVRVYWSHCGTTRARTPQLVGASPIRSWEDITNLGKEVVRRGFTAIKTNIVIPGDPASVYSPTRVRDFRNVDDLNVTPALLRHIEKHIGTFREAVGPDVDIALDLNFHFKAEACMRIAKVLEPFNLMWLEIDNFDPQALLQIKQSSNTRICSCETLYTTRDYKPFFDLHAMDVAMIDVPWNGFSASKKIADLAEIYEINVAPHNYYSHLSSLTSASLCAVSSDIRIMEIDIDDVPWKSEIVTEPIEIKDGYLILPKRPGWGVDLNEKEIAKHPWMK